MILLNFAHPLTDAQREQVAQILNEQPVVRDIAVQIDRSQALADVACVLADAAELTSQEWQTQPLIINPPGLAPLAVALVAEIHGRCGHFPALINMRPVAGVTPQRYEVAEIVNLQQLRDTARTRRS